MNPTPIVPRSFGAPLGMYSHGVIAPAGDIVVVAGQTGIRADGSVAGDDVGTQTRQALENVKSVLEAAGCAMTDIVRLQTFLVSRDDIPAFMETRKQVYPTHFPTGVYPPNTLLVITGLVLPALRVEIEAIAVRARRASRSARSASTRSSGKSRTAAAKRTSRRRR